MTSFRHSLVLLGTSVFLFSCKSQQTEDTSALPPTLSDSDRQTMMERGNEAAAALMKNLSTQLKAALSSGGPVEAVRVCQQIALPLTTSTSGQFDGLEIRRTSLKVRNPKNAPDSIDREVLERWQTLADQNQALPEHELQQSAEQGTRFYKPIVIQAVCLKCHAESDSLDPPLRETLDNLYPADQARGYQEGDLRGAIRVDFPPTSP